MRGAETNILAIEFKNHIHNQLQHVLARVVCASDDTVKITLTEGTYSYERELTTAFINTLNKSDRARWGETFRDLLLGFNVVPPLELVAISTNSTMSIVLREVAATPLKVCSFEVPQSEKSEISLFDWALELVKMSNSQKHLRLSYERQLKEKNNVVSLLESRSQELLATTQAHETELLRSFCLLLNSKKDCIRSMRIEDNIRRKTPRDLRTITKRASDYLEADHSVARNAEPSIAEGHRGFQENHTSDDEEEISSQSGHNSADGELEEDEEL